MFVNDPSKVTELLVNNPTNFIELGGTYRIQGFIETMMHRIPDAPCMGRVKAIVDECKGKKVLHLGCRGESEEPSELHGELLRVGEIVYGVDILPLNCPNFYRMDLEKDDWVSEFKDKEIDIIVASEVMEHLCNAGYFLENMRKLDKPVIITVPNAHCQTQYSMMRIGIEYDNGTHMAKYSYHTMKNMLERHGFVLDGFAWLDWVVPYYSKHILFLALPGEVVNKSDNQWVVHKNRGVYAES